MNTEQKPTKENKNAHLSQMLIGIFNIVVFICGTVLLVINFFFSGDNFSTYITYLALIMLIMPSLYYLVSLIKHMKHK